MAKGLSAQTCGVSWTEISALPSPGPGNCSFLLKLCLCVPLHTQNFPEPRSALLVPGTELQQQGLLWGCAGLWEQLRSL